MYEKLLSSEKRRQGTHGAKKRNEIEAQGRPRACRNRRHQPDNDEGDNGSEHR